jgi:hypothetical protein
MAGGEQQIFEGVKGSTITMDIGNEEEVSLPR